MSIRSLLTALLCACLGAQAQSSFSIPNPIMRPQSQAIAQGADAHPPGAEGLPTPKVPPLPQPIGQAAIPGQSISGSAPSNETVIRETLATFNVTAIVGDAAVLRNNVGYQPVLSQNGQSQGYGQGYGPSSSQAACCPAGAGVAAATGDALSGTGDASGCAAIAAAPPESAIRTRSTMRRARCMVTSLRPSPEGRGAHDGLGGTHLHHTRDVRLWDRDIRLVRR